MKSIRFALICFFLSSCSTTSIDDQTARETAVKSGNDYKIKVEGHTHGAHYWFPEKKMCNAIKKAPDTLESYHPIHAIETFPSPYERPLRRGYDFDLKPSENLVQKLGSGKVYGRTYYDYGPRESFVYKRCMTSSQKTLVDHFMSTMRACYGSSFGIYIEKFGGGASIEGDNGRDCYSLGGELIKAHAQGYSPSFIEGVTGLFGGGQVGSIIKVFDRCRAANKRLDMSYQDDKLIFNCQDKSKPLSLLNETHQ